jgi:hypothetical protein
VYRKFDSARREAKGSVILPPDDRVTPTDSPHLGLAF